MKTQLTLWVLACGISQALLAQTPDTTVNKAYPLNTDGAYHYQDSLGIEHVEKAPEFPGGEQAMYNFLSSNIHYPAKAKRKGIQGTVVTTFVVEKDGSITHVETLKSVHPLIDAEAIRVISMMPKWIPGFADNKPVKVRYTLPLKFHLY